jgi:hypothetical protein
LDRLLVTQLDQAGFEEVGPEVHESAHGPLRPDALGDQDLVQAVL